MKKRKVFIGVVILVVLFSIMLFTAIQTQKQTQGEMLCEWAQTEVSYMLKSPATAQYPHCFPFYSEKDNAYWIEGDVDAENGYGALIRTRYYCPISKIGEDTFETEGECIFYDNDWGFMFVDGYLDRDTNAIVLK